MNERIIGNLGLPVQQSMTARPGDYSALNMPRSVLGVILQVNPSDSDRNRSAYQKSDYRGYLHTCSVMVVEDGRNTYYQLNNVVITPDSVSGLNNYYEKLPRGCTSLVDGTMFNAQMNVNPYDLDGDWCVIGFLGGSMDSPYIQRWWPHPRNPYDAQTSGSPVPGSRSNATYLNQFNRHFERINGVEFVVSREGNIYLSTYRANSALSYGSDLSAEEGRFPRELNENTGGSIKCWVKASQAFELDFNDQINGMGALDVGEDSLPQNNPVDRNTPREEKENTYILVEKDRVHITTSDEIKVVSKQSLLLESSEDTTITVGGDLGLDITGNTSLSTSGLDVDVSQNLDLDITGSSNISILQQLDLQITGTASIQATASLNIGSNAALTLSGSTVSIGAGGSSGTPGSINVSPGGIDLGTGSLGGAVGGTNLQIAFAVFQTAVTAAAATATVETAAFNALNAAVIALNAAIVSAISTTTRVG